MPQAMTTFAPVCCSICSTSSLRPADRNHRILDIDLPKDQVPLRGPFGMDYLAYISKNRRVTGYALVPWGDFPTFLTKSALLRVRILDMHGRICKAKPANA